MSSRDEYTESSKPPPSKQAPIDAAIDGWMKDITDEKDDEKDK